MLPICISTFAFYSASISSFIPFRSVVNAVSNWQSFFSTQPICLEFPVSFLFRSVGSKRFQVEREGGGEVFFHARACTAISRF